MCTDCPKSKDPLNLLYGCHCFKEGNNVLVLS